MAGMLCAFPSGLILAEEYDMNRDLAASSNAAPQYHCFALYDSSVPADFFKVR
jgi:hypothetical protein